MKELERQVYTRIMDQEAVKKIRLISHPTVAERIRGFLLLIRSLQRKPDTRTRGTTVRGTGDFVGGEYE